MTAVLSMMMRMKEEQPNLKIDFVDVFCERGVYNAEQSRRVLLAGKAFFGAAITLHGEELSYQAAGELAAELRAASLSHGEFLSQQGIRAMGEARVAAVLCPATVHALKLRPPPTRSLLQAGVAVALGSDFCPNAHCHSLPMAMHLAVLNCGLSLNEALVAATINAASALNRAQLVGSLEVGKQADALLLDCPDWRHLIYEFGDVRSLISRVVKAGRLVR